MAKGRWLNGWRRLWIVFAGATLLLAVGWGVVEGGKQHRIEYQVLSGFKNPTCVPVLRMPAGSKLDPEPDYGSPCWHLHFYRSFYHDAKQTEDGYIEHMRSLRLGVMGLSIVFGLIVWMVGVALVYGLGAVVAWVLKGFRSGGQTPVQ